MGRAETNTGGSGEHETEHRAVEGLPEGTWSALGGLQSKLKGQADSPGDTSTQIRALGDNEKQTEASGGEGGGGTRVRHRGANDRGDQ